MKIAHLITSTGIAILIALSPGYVHSEDAQPPAANEASVEATPEEVEEFLSEPSSEDPDQAPALEGKMQKHHETEEKKSKSDCSDVLLGGLTLSVQKTGETSELRVSKGSLVLQKVDPYIDGPGNKCLKLKSYPKASAAVLEFCHGSAGTSTIVERHSLLVYKLKDEKLQLVKELDLKFSENDGHTEKLLQNGSYKVKESSGKLKIKIKDRITKKTVEHTL